MKPKNKKDGLLTLLSWAGKEKKKIIASASTGVLSGLLSVAPFVSIFMVIDHLYKGTADIQTILQLSLFTLAVILLRYLLQAASSVLSHEGAFNALYEIRRKVTGHMANLPMGYFSQHQTGELKKSLIENTDKLEVFLAHNIPDLAAGFVTPIVTFAYLAAKDWRLALVSLLPIPVILILQMLMFVGSEEKTREFDKALGDLNSNMIEYIGGMKLIKAYNLGMHSYIRYSAAIEGMNRYVVKLAKVSGPLTATYFIAMQSGILFLAPIGGNLFLEGQISASIFMLFLVVGSLYLGMLKSLITFSSTLTFIIQGIGIIGEILDTPIVIGGDAEFSARPDISVQNVSFSYRPGQPVLINLSFDIPSGQKVAVIGPSGAGKSTVAQLIARYYDPDAGKIQIGNVDIKNVDYDTLLSNVSIVFQNTFLMNSSVEENIRMGKPQATMNEIIDAAKKAQIHEFIQSLPNGYKTSVGDRGARFSGGEKQRIAIARAILKNAPILILDEATSSADPENQWEITKAIDALAEGKTVIFIAHRLSIMKKCDRILVIENGLISGDGNHEELMHTNRYYHNIWSAYERSKAIQYRSRGEQE